MCTQIVCNQDLTYLLCDKGAKKSFLVYIFHYDVRQLDMYSTHRIISHNVKQEVEECLCQMSLPITSVLFQRCTLQYHMQCSLITTVLWLDLFVYHMTNRKQHVIGLFTCGSPLGSFEGGPHSMYRRKQSRIFAGLPG